jgi:hypothetical protein
MLIAKIIRSKITPDTEKLKPAALTLKSAGENQHARTTLGFTTRGNPEPSWVIYPTRRFVPREGTNLIGKAFRLLAWLA